MMGKLIGWDDTIVALATAPGIAAIAVIRLSGKNAWSITNSLFPSKDILKQSTHTIHVGFLKEEDTILDEVVISLFKGPSSYTGEDVVEISCHGSPFIHQQIMNACILQGARMAKPGEFTQRAFLNAKLDLTQAEAVADIILSNTNASHKTALNNIRGGFSKVLQNLREKMLSFSALIELELDFSQEDVEFADRTKFYELVNDSLQTTNALIDSFALGNVIKNGVSVAIIGKPNAGKSTLLNSLLNEDRAIVSDIPGTTRDTIEEIINIKGILFRLIDTAGIREHTTDLIEAVGVGKSLEKMKQADLVLKVFDSNEVSIEELQFAETEFLKQGIQFLFVINKIDLNSNVEIKEKENIIFISAKENQGLENLTAKMVEKVLAGKEIENTIITNARHYNSLKEVETSLKDIKAGLDNNISGDLMAIDIRRCLHYLGDITGEITNEDQLDYIFSKFCIGK
jgi:tRNA modification GTPase